MGTGVAGNKKESSISRRTVSSVTPGLGNLRPECSYHNTCLHLASSAERRTARKSIR